MAVIDFLNTDVKPAGIQASLAYSSESIRDEFQTWLADGNARKYSIEVLLSCMDRISNYVVRKKISAGSLWEYINHNAFTPVYYRLFETKLLRIIDRNTHKVSIIARQSYLQFEREAVFSQKDGCLRCRRERGRVGYGA